ncbi:MAG: tripartite ATP-independent transporter DctM subunit [Gammaproteobacteria bacterium]|jgi:tripartite ATP-independent transporter DctM subunit
MYIVWFVAFALMLVITIFLIALGLPVAFAFLTADIVGVMLFMGGDAGLAQLVRTAANALTKFALVPVPLFLIMGELFFHTGLGFRAFNALDKLLGRLPGRLSFVTIGGGTLFAALSGSSMASTALLGTLMVPEMSKRGYKNRLSIGPILGVGGLAILIPPSALAVLLGSLAHINIGMLLVAGIMPGLLLALLYTLYIVITIRLDPDAAPAYDVEETPFKQKLLLLLRDVLPMGFIVFLVVGMIILGWATPTESAACGVAGVIILAACKGCLTFDALVKSFLGATRVTVMMFMIILGASTFSKVLAFSGATTGLVTWVSTLALTPIAALLTMFIIMLLMGAFMEQLSMMMLTLPIFVPLAHFYGFDLIWFGVIVLLALEMSLTMPPMGLLLFVMKGVAPPGTRLQDIWRAAIPFMACAAILLVLLIFFPEIALWLPNLSKGG